MRTPFTIPEKESLEWDVSCRNLPTKQEYVSTLKFCGFTEVVWEDMTEEWTLFVTDRLQAFVRGKDRFVSIHGIVTYEHLFSFYRTIALLFAGGHLGGVRLKARKS